MTPDQVTLIRRSWQSIEPRRDAIAAAFYARLFELDPHARALFAHVDLEAQGVKFMSTFEALLRVLDDPFRLVSDAIPSGRRHAGYGVQPRDYATAGQAFIAALADHLGDEFTAEVREAWRELYLLVAAVMQRAGRGSAAVAAAAE